MKVTVFIDKENTAIHRMAKYIEKANPHHQFKILPFHPKRPSPEQIENAEAGIKWADVIDFQYWKTAELIRSMFVIDKPSVLTHHNPYDVTQQSWIDYDINVVLNQDQANRMNTPVTLIGHPVDIYFWKYQPKSEYKKEQLNTVLMVANRIEGKKGILPVCEATKRLGMKMVLVGRPSKPDYLAEVQKYDHVEYKQGITDEELREEYYRAGIHICNSVDDFESGTLPILESMACGLPVLTRKIGHVPETNNGKNMVVRNGDPDDVDELVEKLEQMRSDYEGMLRMREAAWYTVKNRNIEIFGRKYSNAYYRLITKKLVSVIIPTYNRMETLHKCLTKLLEMDGPHIEIVIADDGSTDGTGDYINQLYAIGAVGSRATIKYVRTDRYDLTPKGISKSYGIAHARNVAIREAEGEFLMFVDTRIGVEKGALNAFLKRFEDKEGDNLWVWGMKDNIKKAFVENFSFVKRTTLIKIGMFSEVISQYGGMTQEIRKRAGANGIRFEFVEDAKADGLAKAKGKEHKWEDIAKSKTQCFKLGFS